MIVTTRFFPRGSRVIRVLGCAVATILFFESHASGATVNSLDPIIETSVSELLNDFSQTPLSEESQLERRLQADASDGTLDEMGLLDAAMIAAGHEDPNIRATLISQFNLAANRLAKLVGEQSENREKAAVVLRFLHDQFLTGSYHAARSDPVATLCDGNFNCVSATLLYLHLARRCGLNAQAIGVPGHVFCRVEQQLDVQTTCADWLDGDSPAEVRHSPANRHSRAGGKPANRRVLNDVQIVSLVYYNRGIEWLQNGEFPAALVTNYKALRLDPQNESARVNLLATVNNWALDLANEKKFSQASAVLGIGMRIDANYENFRHNDLYIHRHWIDELIEKGKTAKARQVLTLAGKRRPDESTFAKWLERLPEKD